jgi:cytochrome c peroxidase
MESGTAGLHGSEQVADINRNARPTFVGFVGKNEVDRFDPGPILRGLAARAPYFHNGSAATLMDVVNFYDERFSIGFTSDQKQDLVNFLNAL